MDLFVTHWIAQENAFYSSMHADYREAGLDPSATSLRFMDLADRFGLGQIALDYVGWGTAFFDYDNDGRQDLIIANGSTFGTRAMRKVFLKSESQVAKFLLAHRSAAV